MTYDEFYKLVEDGCEMCTTAIFPVDAEELLWTTERRPVCPDCANSLTLDDVSAGYIIH